MAPDMLFAIQLQVHGRGFELVASDHWVEEPNSPMRVFHRPSQYHNSQAPFVIELSNIRLGGKTEMGCVGLRPLLSQIIRLCKYGNAHAFEKHHQERKLSTMSLGFQLLIAKEDDGGPSVRLTLLLTLLITNERMRRAILFSDEPSGSIFLFTANKRMELCWRLL
jgi:hypothetical protein